EASEHIDEASADARWLWIPPTLVIVGIGVFALVQVLPGQSHPKRQERLFARANAACQAHVPAGLSLTYAVPMTAKTVTATARFLHNSPAPWDKLPESHFVAKCIYSDVKIVAASEHVPCASGR